MGRNRRTRKSGAKTVAIDLAATDGRPDQASESDVVVGVAEADRANYFIVRQFIERLRRPWRVCRLTSVESALEACRNDELDVLLVGEQFDGGTAVDVLDSVGETSTSLSVIVVAESGDELLERRLLAAGADAVLVRRLLSPTVIDRAVRAALSARRRARTLNREKERYEAALGAVEGGIWDLDRRTGEFFISAAARGLLDFSANDQTSDLAAALAAIEPTDRAALLESMQRQIAGDADTFEREVRVRTRAGEPRWLCVRGRAYRDARGGIVRVSGSIDDITERRIAEDAVMHRAMHDELTGASNRAHLEVALREATCRAATQPGYALGLIYFDLDDFKPVNDRYGHAAGDELLKLAVARLRSGVRQSDTVARIGGDEFVVLLAGCASARELDVTAEKLRARLREDFRWRQHILRVGASVGTAWSSDGEESLEALLHRADQAMYADKRARKSAPTSESSANARKSDSHGADIRHALRERQIVGYFQPVVDLSDATVVGWEALARWHHPAGVRTPDQFLPTIDTLGLDGQLCARMLDEACAHLSRRPQHEWVAVNVTARDLVDEGFAERVTTALAEHGVAPSRLRLELVEHAPVVDAQRARDNLAPLIDMGVVIAVDDFGSGYANANVLFDLPVSTLKIDRGIVARLHRDPRAIHVLRSFIRLAGDLGIEVIAEGVESDQEREVLAQEGVRWAQGYLFGAPAHEPLRLAA